jgi:hypothetical protein
MHHRKLRFLGTALLIVISVTSKAQFSVEAQLRNRFEVRDGYQKLANKDATPAAFMSQRTRVGFVYNTDNFRFKFTPQDVRIWGDEQNATLAGVTGDNASLDMFEGYGEIKIGEDNWLSVGRQTLVYDNQWLLSARNWNQNGVSSDAVVLKINQFDWNIHLGGTWNTQKEASSDNIFPVDKYKTLNFLWANRKFSDNIKISLLHIASGQTETDTTNKIHFRQTSGIFGQMQFSNLTVVTNGYYQYGKNQAGKDVGAFLGFVDISYSINPLIFGLGANYLSGNKKVGADMTTDNLFDPIYTARHRYFGFIDYFRTFSSHTKQGGLSDIFTYVEYKPFKGFSIQNTGHLFHLAQTNSTTPNSKFLGYENDLVFKYKFADWGTAELGHAMFFPEKALKELQNVPENKFSQFLYIQLTLTPILYSACKKTPIAALCLTSK